ncbi:MAG: hypothetical protein ACT4O1_00240 [Gemmatimonadota bacterium]
MKKFVRLTPIAMHPLWLSFPSYDRVRKDREYQATLKELRDFVRTRIRHEKDLRVSRAGLHRSGLEQLAQRNS